MSQPTVTEPTYTFVSVSTAKPGRLDDLIDLASRPSERMEGKVPGMLARQVSVDRKQNTVIVWVTFAQRSDLYDYLASGSGKDDHDTDDHDKDDLETDDHDKDDHDTDDHGEGDDMGNIIETFEMYDLAPVSGRLAATA